MTVKKAKLSSRLLNATQTQHHKPSTVTRAAITAEVKPTRGKQLVEHHPASLIPDPSNPRPGEQIDDAWLMQHLLLGTEHSLCRVDANGEYHIPLFYELNIPATKGLEEDYDFLRNLALSIRHDGLIEPIEIFLADRNNDPEYFVNSDLDYGYVVLEGHQRRLAGIMAGVKTITCIELTDETDLARLKVRHRKLRRQLSENNLRKGLTVGQNFKIVRELFKTDESDGITVKELSAIIGLNEEIAGALKRLSTASEHYPPSMFNLIENSLVSFKWIRMWISKSYAQIDAECHRLLEGHPQKAESKVKSRGRLGGAVKRSAMFKINKEQDSIILQNFLLKIVPELNQVVLQDLPFHSLEKVLARLLELAKLD